MAKLPRPTAPEMADLLLATIASKPEVEWADILAAVSAKYTVKNWLTQVRSPLQWLMNERKVERINDIRREAYRVVR